MDAYRIVLTPQSAFATPLKGDTLFGQLCWAIRNRFGEKQLSELLDGYTGNKPFAVLSDAFPAGYLPLPKLPVCFYHLPEGDDRKAVKKRAWLPEPALQQPLAEWLQCAKTSKDVAASVGAPPLRLSSGQASVRSTAETADTSESARGRASYTEALSKKHPQPHNTINSLTGTTGEGGFAPYSIEQEWFVPGLRWEIYLLLDTNRFSAADCEQCLKDIGTFGYGKDASIGMGKFAVDGFETQTMPA